MKVLISGAAGHIGSALLRAVLPHWEVTALDNFVTGRYASLFNLPAPIRLIEADLTTTDLDKAVAGQDCVIHLAALTDAASSLGLVGAYTHINAEGTNRLARACRDAGVPLVFASTTSVYGPQEQPVDETLEAMHYHPQSPYASSKLAAERVLLQHWIGCGLRCTILRFGTIYGTSPGMRFHTAVNRFCWQAAYGQPITVWKDAWDSKRPYCSLVRAVGALKNAVYVLRWWEGVRPDTEAHQTSHLYNIVSQHYTVRQVIDTLALASGYDAVYGVVREVEAPILNQQSYEVVSQYELAEYPDEPLLDAVTRTLELLKGAHDGK